MNRTHVLIIASFFLLLAAIAPVRAIGPTNAADVGNNPNVFINSANGKTALNTPNGESSALDRITWLNNQVFVYFNVSNVNGLKNAVIADINTVQIMITNPIYYENKWVYLSGENSGNQYDDPTDNPDVGSHGMFYWWIRAQGFSHEDALASILARNPNGGYVKTNYVGP